MNIISHVYMLRCTTEVRSANRIVVEVEDDFLYRKKLHQNCGKISIIAQIDCERQWEEEEKGGLE